MYDLGLLDPVAVPAALTPARVEVAVPGWLSGSAMQYRLAWKQPERRRSYVESRWAAAPADMLSQSLTRALRPAGGEAAQSRCRLKVDLDEFVQVFEAQQRSHVELVARARLLPARGELPLAARDFSRHDAADTADAEGGVRAARSAVRGLAEELAAWLVELDRNSVQGLNDGGRCAPS
ncbi:MAG: membrane integrity-associated transporter subunit PqiC [Proteobacteria bacterium]|nr:membrane integrity-associated transporter subunit PqiC [Pseudomonadota bacterium]